MVRSYVGHVKTTVTLPEDLYERAERVARRLGVSRGQLYSRALELFLAQCAEEDALLGVGDEVEPDGGEGDPPWADESG